MSLFVVTYMPCAVEQGGPCRSSSHYCLHLNRFSCKYTTHTPILLLSVLPLYLLPLISLKHSVIVFTGPYYIINIFYLINHCIRIMYLPYFLIPCLIQSLQNPSQLLVLCYTFQPHTIRLGLSSNEFHHTPWPIFSSLLPLKPRQFACF